MLKEVKNKMALLGFLSIGAGLAILIGLLVLIFPRLLRWGIGIFLIIWGILQFVANYL